MPATLSPILKQATAVQVAAREDHRQEKSRRGPGAGAVAGVAISSWGWRRLGGYVGVG
ncbi:MAG TPA: hypothetical protein VHN80_11250 [Kineosporiaceae bacterium]|jgi:hypothetical protein|nr:hypothetical protein [Kineosporiaceae bacterium]